MTSKTNESLPDDYTLTGKGRFQILSLDGGGIKGLFSAAVLAKLEEDLQTKMVDHFDLIVGTSTGGIIALGLGLGMSPREIVEFYVEDGKKIFPPGIHRAAWHWFHAKFCQKPLQDALQQRFGDKPLGDSLKRLVVPSYNLGLDDVYNFKTAHHPKFKRDYRLPAWKVALATSAAPTYLPAFRGIDSHRLIDGGVWANNPIMVGLVEALSYLEVPIDDISICSLGTSDAVIHRKKHLNTGGKLLWANTAVDVVMRGQSKGAISQAGLILGKDRVERLDPVVPEQLFRLDKLALGELLSHAAHESRCFSTVFERKFLGHAAPEFKPFHHEGGPHAP